MKRIDQKQWNRAALLRMIGDVKRKVKPDAYWERGWRDACDEILHRIKESKKR